MLRKEIFFLTLIVFLFTAGVGCISFSSQSQGTMGMYRSDNQGESWKPISAFPTLQGVKSLSGLKVYKVYTDPSDINALYLGTRSQGLYYSYDNGDSWQVVQAMANKYIYGLAVDPKDKCNLYLTDGSHIYKTTDCLRTWKLVFTEERLNERFVDLAIDPIDSKNVYALQLNGDLLRSNDSGKSWRIIKRFGFGVRVMVIDNVSSNKNKIKRIYVASYQNGLFRSDDNGNNWVDVSGVFKDFSGSTKFNRLVLNPNKADSLFWVSKYGILRSDNAGKTWKEIKLLTPPGSVDIFSFAVSPKNDKELYYTGTVLDSKSKNLKSTFYKSLDGGDNWVTKKLPTNTIPVSMHIHPVNTKMIFLGFTELDSSKGSSGGKFGI